MSVAVDGDPRLQEVVIVGGGTAGWMTAAALSRFLNNGRTRITLVESDEIGTVGVGEATIPTIAGFNHLLGIDEDEFLRATQGTFKLGIEFVDWARTGDRYFHQFGNFGTPIDGVEFNHVWRKLHDRGEVGPLADFSPSAVAAAAGRFARRAGDPRSPFHGQVYAFHFDAGFYARYLRAYAERGGVARVEGRVVSVERDPATGHVAAVLLADGRRITGELFIDCSGFRSLLVSETMGSGYEDWSRWLPCDRAVAVPCANPGPPSPFTRATARSAGWQWRIPLQHRMGNGYVYSSAHLDRQDAEDALVASLEAPAAGEPRHLRFVAGRRHEAWASNCIAIGLSAGFLEPLESTSIHLIQTGISKLLALFPDRHFREVERREYNRLMANAFLSVRDFLILHYNATERDDSPFWDHCRTMDVPDSLKAKLELFAPRGRIFRYDDELFTVDSWVAVLNGQRRPAEGYDQVADAFDEARIAGGVERMRRLIADTVAAMPTHAEFIRANCAAPPIAAAPPRAGAMA